MVVVCMAGCQEMAHDLRTLRHHGVTHILNVTAEVVDMNLERSGPPSIEI